MKIIGWMIVTPFIVLALFFTARFLFCGPDRGVIKVMKPVAQIMADDIIKNGIPESLADIEKLPYKLVGCSKSEVFRKRTAPVSIVEKKENADSSTVTESCTFTEKNKLYSIDFWFYEDFHNKKTAHGKILISDSNTYTRFSVRFNTNNDEKLMRSLGHEYSIHHGILCSSFKQ